MQPNVLNTGHFAARWKALMPAEVKTLQLNEAKIGSQPSQDICIPCDFQVITCSPNITCTCVRVCTRAYLWTDGKYLGKDHSHSMSNHSGTCSLRPVTITSQEEVNCKMHEATHIHKGSHTPASTAEFWFHSSSLPIPSSHVLSRNTKPNWVSAKSGRS